MALNITYVPASHKPGRSLTPVPPDVAEQLDKLAASQADNPNPSAITIARLDSPEERDRFVAHLRTWADERAIKVRKVKGTDDPSSYAFRLYPAA